MSVVKKSDLPIEAAGPATQTVFKVAVDAPAPDIYSYLAKPGTEVLVGQMVKVPFGWREVLGYVMSTGPDEPGRKFDLKSIKEVIVAEPLFGPDFIKMVEFVSNYYLYPPGLCIKEILPGGLSLKLNVWIGLTQKGFEAGSSLTGPAAEVFEVLAQTYPEPRLFKELLAHKSAAQRLVREGLAELVYRVDGRKSGFAYEWYLSAVPDSQYQGRVGPKEKRLWDLVKGAPPTPLSHFRNILDNPLPQAKSLAAKGLIVMESKERFRDDPNRAINLAIEDVLELTNDQHKALAAIEGALTSGQAGSFLLFGVTGSGKTEVYLRAAQKALEAGRGVLWLAPEIALTMGLEGRLKSRFPNLPISVLHSGLTAGQRHDHWLALSRGVSRLALGARSAVFAPISNLGLVVVDEEHDWAYKQDDGLRYNGRDLAAWRARESEAVLILGSATPSMESYQGTITGRLELLRMDSRPGLSVLPEVVIVDRRSEAKSRQKAIAPELRDSLTQAFQRGEQALMFINRRGTANLPMCLACGQVLKCSHCNLALTLHSKIDGELKSEQEAHTSLGPDSLLVCHGCGYRAKPPAVCPQCDSKLVRYLGVGTESLMKLVEKDFGKKGLRLDTDSTKLKGGLKEILERFAKREADFLVGTQMAAKGHDFSLLTIVGVIEADLGLNVADFRAAERTFQLLSQVSGRAGRRERPGKVYIQTRNPDHYTMTTARDHDYETFFNNEIEIRKELGYPPFARLALIRIIGPEEKSVSHWAEKAAQRARGIIGDTPPEELELFGPAPAPLTKLREKFRYQMMLRSKTSSGRHRVLKQWLPGIRSALPADIYLTVDVDPYNLI
ncbi:MAG: primosomal protein N' [Deltaproteobacteria bacterium]|jgi:primosomal protein N' (replication factor Y)|nr:primosomal protein N' [Deltaproteobacteria bacterium]